MLSICWVFFLYSINVKSAKPIGLELFVVSHMSALLRRFMVGRNFEYGFVNKRENLLFVDKIFLYFQDS